MRKAEAETIKLYISKQVDRFRPAYGRRLQVPSSMRIHRTTNETQLRDTTGAFWVVDTPKSLLICGMKLTAETIKQIWAEGGGGLYNAGEKLYLTEEPRKDGAR